MGIIFRNRDASPLVPLLVFAVTINGALWAGYGVAIGNYFIAGPNFVATLVGVLQIVCITFFGRKEAEETERALEEGSGSNGGEYRDDPGSDEEGDDDDGEGEGNGQNETNGNVDGEGASQKQQQKQRRAAKRQTNRRRRSAELEAASDA